MKLKLSLSGLLLFIPVGVIRVRSAAAPPLDVVVGFRARLLLMCALTAVVFYCLPAAR